MTSTTLLLVRHAHAEWVPDEMRPLSEMGRVDAERVADILSAYSPSAIYSSPYRRARETVGPVSARLGVAIEELDELRERSLGRVRVADWQAEIQPTWVDFSLAYPEGGETNAEVMERARSVLDTVRSRHQGQTVVLATHGNLLVLFLRLLDPALGFDFWRQLTLPDIFRLELVADGGFELHRLWA